MSDFDGVKIAHFGNMAEDGYPVVKALQERGINAHQYVTYPNFVCGLPQWEYCDLDIDDIGDPFQPNLEVMNRDFISPDWLHTIFLTRKSRFDFLTRWLRGRKRPFHPRLRELLRYVKVMRYLAKMGRVKMLTKLMRQYQLVIAHVPFGIYTPYAKVQTIIFDGGAIRYLRGYYKQAYDRYRMRLLETGYRKAFQILVTNPDTLDIFRRYKMHNVTFMPFLIDTERYKPMDVDHRLDCEHVVFVPSRQNWEVKGHHLLMQAFAKFHKEYSDSKLVMVNWGTEVKASKRFVHRLGLDSAVEWVKLMSKPKLIRWYNRATVIADQFILGSYGTSTPEAMACGKSVIMYLSPSHMLETFGEQPPVLNAKTVDDIYSKLILTTDPTFRRKQDKLSRDWVLKHHSPKVVVDLHLKVYEKALAG